MRETAAEHLESLRDGRLVYIGSESVTGVTAHPAFRNGAHSIAAPYDMKPDPAGRVFLIPLKGLHGSAGYGSRRNWTRLFALIPQEGHR